MSGDALRQALRLRHLAAESAQRELLAAIAAENGAAAALAAHRAVIRDQIAAASALDADDAVVEALGPWLRQARAVTSRHEADLAAAEAVTVRARAALAAARIAEESVAELLRAAAAEARVRADRQEQAGLDEAARHPYTRRPPRPGK